ncbi:MAG: flagellar basal body protein [Fibrobacterales bacterium]
MNINGIASAVSGLKASSTRMNVSGHNIANVNTDDFKAQVVNQHDDNGIVDTTISRDTSEGPIIQRTSKEGTQESVEMSNVDLSKEAANQILASSNYKANVKTIQTQDEILGTIIDLTK